MGCIIIFYAPKLAELQAMLIHNRFGDVEPFHPHSHTHIFHFKQLHKVVIISITSKINTCHTALKQCTCTINTCTQEEKRGEKKRERERVTLNLCFSNSDTMKCAMSDDKT